MCYEYKPETLGIKHALATALLAVGRAFIVPLSVMWTEGDAAVIARLREEHVVAYPKLESG